MKKLFASILLVMTLLLTSNTAFAARAVTGSQVMRMLYKFQASRTALLSYVEVSEAIAAASTQDPLFPEYEEGSELTATILVSIAWHESRFVREAIGDHGRSFGLYQIQPPTAQVDSKILLLPKSASFVAIDLIRTSLRYCAQKGRSWREGLAWYAASSEEGARHPKIVAQSRSRMELAAKLFTEFFAQPETVGFGLLLSQKS